MPCCLETPGVDGPTRYGFLQEDTSNENAYWGLSSTTPNQKRKNLAPTPSITTAPRGRCSSRIHAIWCREGLPQCNSSETSTCNGITSHTCGPAKITKLWPRGLPDFRNRSIRFSSRRKGFCESGGSSRSNDWPADLSHLMYPLGVLWLRE